MSLFGIELWVVLAVGGAIAQTTRNATAGTIASQISPALNSWSRFSFCLPWVTLLCFGLALRDGWPTLGLPFFAFCSITAVTQLLANVALVIAFRGGRFGESIVFHKLEVLLTALAGALLFGERPGALAALGILLCAVGVIGMNLAREEQGFDLRGAFRFGPSGRYALLCAGLLVFASFALKLANAEVRAANPGAGFFEGAVQTLFHTTWIEVLLLSMWIGLREPASFQGVRPHLRSMVLIGTAGFAASLCWFWSFSLTQVAFAKAVGQIEALLAVGLGVRMMGERTLLRQLPGVGLTVVGILLVLLG